jgi:hypothetical protein
MATTNPGPTTTPTAAAATSDRLEVVPDEPTGSGWIFFAGTILGLSGLMRIIDSIWAFRYHGAIPDNLQNGIFGSDLKNYAWAWLAVGVILIISSFLLLAGSQFARWVGFIAAAIGGLSAMTWMPYYPIWSLTYVALAVLVFYALARYGGREAAARRLG